jgi:tol-pal system protein YbgF
MRMNKIAIALLVAALAVPASAGTKEQLIQLQTQVQGLQDQMARMQQSFDERMGVMRNLVEQSTDNINRMTQSVQSLQKAVEQVDASNDSNVGQLSGQVQALHDSMDEVKARMARVSKQLEEMQAARTDMLTASAPVAGQAPPADVLYNDGLRDYNAGKYDLAVQEFGDYLKFYGNTDLAGNAQFYLADIYYRQGNFQTAVQEYDKVLEQYPGGNKAAAAQLKKGYALLELGNRNAGVAELKSLVTRFPKSAEAAQAKDRLAKLNAGPTAKGTRKPTAQQR